MMSNRPPRKMKNRIMSNGPRKRAYPMAAAEKVSRLKDAIKKIEEAEKKK